MGSSTTRMAGDTAMVTANDHTTLRAHAQGKKE